MFVYDNYKKNLDLVDKYNIKNVVVDKGLVYRGDLDILNEKAKEKPSTSTSLAAAVLGTNNTAVQLPIEDPFYNSYNDIDTQELYLSSKPTCYLILGKPGCGAYSFGESMSKKLNCIHLCPKNIIADEIEQKSSTGMCIDFNMRHNFVCKVDIIFSILMKKLESPAVKHRGYIISGLPLVTSDRKPYYYFNSLYSEESIQVIGELLYDMICNLKKKKPKKTKESARSPLTSFSSEEMRAENELEEEQEEEKEEAVEEEVEIKVELPKFILDPSSDIIIKKKSYYDIKDSILLQQCLDVMKLKIQSTIIIYITCSDVDLVTKKSHKYLNYLNNLLSLEPFDSKVHSELRWPLKYITPDYVPPFGTHIFNPKYNCKLPINFIDKSKYQMCNYSNVVLPFIEKKLTDFDPKFIIKIDACTSIHSMINHVMEKLLLLPVHPVLIPEPLYLEEPPEDIAEFWKTVEELNVIHSGSINFTRYPSPWYNRCPVELKNRQSVLGNPRYAVTFFKHIYLLSSLGAMVSFCRNPRPYLKLKYLEPTCRIIIIGTKSTGKSLIANCLSWIFDTPIICYKIFLETERAKKYLTYSKTILSEIIATIEDTRFAKWQSAELERYSQLEAWSNFTIENLIAYVPFLIQSFKYMKKEPVVILEEETVVEDGVEQPDEEFLQNINYYKKVLSYLPFLDDLEQCQAIINDKTLLKKFAPADLIMVTSKPNIPVLGDKDVKEAILEYITVNDLQKELEPTPEELMTEMVKIILAIDSKTKESTDSENSYGKYIIDGFPSEPEFWDYLRDAKLFPDYTISLIENREGTSEFFEYFTNIGKVFKNYQEVFIVANDPLVKIKLQIQGMPDSKKIFVGMILHDILNHVAPNDDGFGNNEAESLTIFTEAAEKFCEDWEMVKLKLEEDSKAYIEFELENKTDIQLIEEILLNIRKSYFLTCEENEGEQLDDVDDGDDSLKDVLTYNDPRSLCETNIYCPIAYYIHGVLWEGKPEFSIKFNNKLHYFSKGECSELFQRDVTNYQSYNKPYKKIPPLRICVIGCIGSGKSTVSQIIAKELGLVHIDFSKIVNNYLMPKHFKKVGRYYENSFTDVPIDEAVTDFQIDEETENIISDLMSNETELRFMVHNYFENGTPIHSLLMKKLITKLWFENPFVTTGIVLDGYPRLANDVEDMTTCFCVPDLIIELEGNAETALERLSPILFKTWKMQLGEAKKKAKIKCDFERKEWMNFITKSIVCKLILDEIINNMPVIISEQFVKTLSTESFVIDAHPSGSTNVDINLFNVYNSFIEEYPEPVDTSEWEKLEDARERINSRIESIYEIDEENIQSLKEILSEQKIKIVSVDGTKAISKLVRVILLSLSGLSTRTESFFEQTYIINTDISEMLLLEGFYFLSKFNRMCPVYIFENPYSIINNYKLGRRKGRIFTIAHRSYIYFIYGEENVYKFRENPLKYIDCNFIKTFIEYPIRISVIGTPKSGRSTLAKKLAKRYGLLCVSKGGAIRNVLENMQWTELASKMNIIMQTGDIIDYRLTMKAIQYVTIDHRSNTYGYVFDGFPEFPAEAIELANFGLYPTYVFYILSDKETVVRNSQLEIYNSILKYKPPYSAPFIENRYSKWKESNNGIRNWIDNDHQNLYLLNGTESQWQCLQNAIDIISGTSKNIHYYLANAKTNIVPAGMMCISSELFNCRMSHFKDMCPLCLHQDVLKCSSYPVDRKGIVQYKNTFYWICKDHLDKALKHPDIYLTKESIDIPEIPAPVKTVNMSLVYEKGICLVTYANSLPSQRIIRGNSQYSASFRGNTYLFCSEKCLTQFLERPHLYYEIRVFKQTKEFPIMTLKKIPNLGYLEQSLGSIITDACCCVNVLRPKYPGLSYPLSGLLYIALYLKTHNPLLDKSALNNYKKALKIFEARCKLIIDVGLCLRSMDNPFANYPICCKSKKYQSTGSIPRHSSFVTPSSRTSEITTEYNN